MQRFIAAAIAALFASPVAAECLSPDLLLPGLEPGEAIFAARDVELPETRYLGVVAMRSNEPYEMEVDLWPSPPGARVEERHVCSRVSLRPIGAAADWHRPQFAMALATGVDYAAAYPGVHDRLAALGQLVFAPKGRYRVVRFTGRAPRAGAPEYEAAARGSRGCDGHVVRGERTIVFPLC